MHSIILDIMMISISKTENIVSPAVMNDYKLVQNMVEWCNDNCTDTFTLTKYQKPENIFTFQPQFNFESDDDLIQFQLRWL